MLQGISFYFLWTGNGTKWSGTKVRNDQRMDPVRFNLLCSVGLFANKQFSMFSLNICVIIWNTDHTRIGAPRRRPGPDQTLGKGEGIVDMNQCKVCPRACCYCVFEFHFFSIMSMYVIDRHSIDCHLLFLVICSRLQFNKDT